MYGNLTFILIGIQQMTPITVLESGNTGHEG